MAHVEPHEHYLCVPFLSKNLIPSLSLLYLFSSLSLILFLITLSTHCCFSNTMFHSQTPPFQNTLSFPPALISGPSWNQTLQINNVSVQHSKALSPTTRTCSRPSNIVSLNVTLETHRITGNIVTFAKKKDLFRAAV